MANASISVVIPVHDDLGTLQRAIESVIRQTVPVSEILVIDDGSPGDVDRALGRFSAVVRLLRHDRNLGASAARNTGIAASQSDYIAFLDADDAWHPDKIECQLHELETADVTVGACVAGFAIHREGRLTSEKYQVTIGANFADDLVWGCKISPGSTLLVRRSCYERVGTYDEQLRRLEDWDWLIRFSREYRMISVDKILADIYLSEAAAPYQLGQVIGATERIREKHLPYFSADAWSTKLKFLSTLSIEKAAAHYRNGNQLRAVGMTMQSLITWPLQTTAFFSRFWRTLQRRFPRC